MITLTAEQAQQIEEALDELRYANNTDIAKTKYYKALATIRAARAQEQAEQEPVAWMLEGSNCVEFEYRDYHDGDEWTPLYAAPVQQAEQEPVAIVRKNAFNNYVPMYIDESKGLPEGTKLYAAPGRTKDLTDAEIMKINVDTAGIVPTCDRQFHFARAVIDADRELNR